MSLHASQSAKLTRSVVLAYSSIADLPDNAIALLNQEELGSFDLGADWFLLLHTHALPKGVRPCFYLLQHGDEIKAIFPLLLGSHGVGGFTTFYSSLFRPMLAADVQVNELALLFKQVIKDNQTSTIRLDAMDPLHPSYALTMQGLSMAGILAFSFFSFANRYMPVNGRDFEVYFNGLASKIKNTAKRREKKFLASGRGRIEVLTSKTGIEAAINAWNKIYNASWKKPEPYPNFMPALIRWCAERGWLRFGVAFFDNEPIAAQIWIVSNNRAAIYKLAYDEAFAQYSAGTLLTVHLMRHVLDIDRVHEVDYLIGDDPYKKDWVSHRRERQGIVAFNPKTFWGIAGYIHHQLGRYWQKSTKHQRA